MLIFYRRNFSQLWLNISSNESLGILDTAFIEDYNGVDGQVSFVRLSDGTSVAVPMSSVPDQTPGTPDDYFRGSIALNTLADGDYEIRGRVRDLAGNYTIVGSVASPLGSERVLEMKIRIIAGAGVKYVTDGGAFNAFGGYLVDNARKLTGIPVGRSQQLFIPS